MHQHKRRITKPKPCPIPTLPPHKTNTMNNLVAAAAAVMENDSNWMGESNLHNMKAGVSAAGVGAAPQPAASTSNKRRKNDGKDVSAAKARRLEQNRRAAVESRRRKKVMTEELQRSVAFYTKANASLVLHNQDLEHRLILAKKHLQEMGLAPAEAKSDESDMNSKLSVEAEVKSSTEPTASAESDSKLAAAKAPAVCTEPDLKIPSAESATPTDTKQVVSSSADNESEDEYLEALKQFAAQQSAIATAAAASANAAYQAIKYHEMMKKSGQTSSARFPLEQFRMRKPSSSS